MTQQIDAIVIGAGVAGMTAARTLRGRGLRVLVLESADRIGGQLLGADLEGLDGVRVDVGAEAFAARGTAVSELITGLGLEAVEPAPLSAWCYAAGHTFPLPKAGVMGIPAHVWAPDVRRAVGLTGSLRASADRFLPRKLTDYGTLESFTRSRMGRRVTERLVAPVAGGVHSAPLNRLDINAVAPGLRAAFDTEGSLAKAVASLRSMAPAGSAVRGVVGGMHQVTDTLAANLTATDGDGPAGQIRLNAEVVAIERTSGEWRIGTEEETLTASRLVVTTPRVVDLVSPHVGTVADQVPDPEPGADIRLMTLLLRAPELDDAPRGSGMLIAPPSHDAGRADRKPDVLAKAMTHSTAKWPWLGEQVRAALGPGHHVIRLSYGRFGGAMEIDADTAVADASRLFGVDLRGRTLSSLSTRWNGSLPPPTPAYRREVESFSARVTQTPGLAVTGAWISGTGLAAIVGHATECATEL